MNHVTLFRSVTFVMLASYLALFTVGGEQAKAEPVNESATTAVIQDSLLREDPFPPCKQEFAIKSRTPKWVLASSELAESRLTHTASRATDGDLSTAWVEGVEGSGVGQSLVLGISEGDVPVGVTLVPGYAKDTSRWTKNNRVSKVRVRWLKPKNPENAPTNGSWDRSQLQYTDTAGVLATLKKESGVIPFAKRQVITFGDLWVQNMESTEVVAIELTIMEVDSQGAAYQDTCISEVALVDYGDATGEESCARGWCDSMEEKPKGCTNPYE